MFKPRKVGGWIRAKRGCVGGVGDCLKYLKRGWNRKEEKDNKDFLKKGRGGKLDQGVSALKKGDWNHLTNYG